MTFRTPSAFATALAFAAATAMWPLPAAAHISLDSSNTHKSRYGDLEIKDGPCGRVGGTRGTNVYTYDGGQTITVSLVEAITHPSYFRIAFDPDGDDDFKDPASILPIDPARPCPFNAADKCGASDFYNSSAVLPGMDNLDRHLTAPRDQVYTWQVTLPDVECANCTLQIIQVMEDTIHGAYNPTPGDPADGFYVADVYHQCIDLVIHGSGGPPPVGSGGANQVGSGGANPAGSGGAAALGGTPGIGGSLVLPLPSGGSFSAGSGGYPGVAGTPTGGGGAGTVPPGAGAAPPVGIPAYAGSSAFGGAAAADPSAEAGDEGSCAVRGAAGPTRAAWLIGLAWALLIARRLRVRV